MSQSALEREILYDHDYQAAHKEANAICMTIERRINSWQEFLVEAEKKIFELHEELAGARKNVKRSKQLAEVSALLTMWKRRE